MSRYKFFKNSRKQNSFLVKTLKIYQQQQAFYNELAKNPELMWAISSRKKNPIIGCCLLLITSNMLPVVVAEFEPQRSSAKTAKSGTFHANNSSIPEENLFASSHSAINLEKNSHHAHPIEHVKNTASNEPAKVRKRKTPPASQKNYQISPAFQQRLTAAHTILESTVELLPEKFNLPDTAIFNTDVPTISYSLKNPNEIKRQAEKQKTLEKLLQITNNACVKVRINLAEELSNEAEADPISCYTDEEFNGVNKEYTNYQDYLLRLSEVLTYTEVGLKFKGGTCGHQSAFAVREALKKGLDIELVSLKASGTEHTLTIIGRASDTKLDDPTSWNDDAIILDYWRYGKAPITIGELKKNPERYKIYFHKTWTWSSEKFSATMPENLKGEFYKKHQQLRNYFSFCQRKLTELIQGHSVELDAKPAFKR